MLVRRIVECGGMHCLVLGGVPSAAESWFGSLRWPSSSWLRQLSDLLANETHRLVIGGEILP